MNDVNTQLMHISQLYKKRMAVFSQRDFIMSLALIPKVKKRRCDKLISIINQLSVAFTHAFMDQNPRRAMRYYVILSKLIADLQHCCN